MTSTSFWRKALAWLFSTTRPAPPPGPPTPVKIDDWQPDNWNGVFYFRDNILDKLDETFVYLHRMRRSDPDAYALYSKVGASLVSEDVGYSTSDKLTAWWRAGNRPGFGATSFTPNPEQKAEADKIDHIYARFMYFQKLKQPWFVEPFKGDVYEVTLLYDDVDLGKRPGLPLHYHVGVDAEANMKLLRHLAVVETPIKRKKQRGTTWITRKKWCTPNFSELKFGGLQMFCMVTQTYENALSGAIRITCSKGTTDAVFAIEMKRTAYFFKDRSSGKDKRIFHVVRPHERTYKSGKVRDIKFHFRGLRDFEWNGYQVHVTVPGLHHGNLLDLEAGAIMRKQGENHRVKGEITVRRMALRVQQALRA